MSEIKINEFINSFVSALRSNSAAIFAGAGLSVPAGYINWRELMRSIADDLGLDIDKETDLIALAQYHINERLGNRGRLNQILIDEFTKKATITLNHRILSRLPISTYWTTNYDKLLEQSLKESYKTVDVKIISENIIVTRPHRDAVVYKMHGDAEFPNDAVLTKEDFESYELSRSPFSITLQGDLFSKTFLFIGFSFEDPNLLYILSRIKNLVGTKSARPHYCFFKKETKKELKRKQELRLKDLHRYGINGILVDQYSEIPQILSKVEALYKRSQIFISGAAENFRDFSTEDLSKKFIHDLSKRISEQDFKIISGFGFNVGSSVINGTLEHIFSTNNRSLDNYLKLMPFPQFQTGDFSSLTAEEQKKKKRDRNNKYRDIMLSEAGIAIFLFGNKKDSGRKIRLSSGMEEEFELAIRKGIKPIPIGATGYCAKKLHTLVVKNFSKYFEPEYISLKPLFRKIGDKSLDHTEIIDSVSEIIRKLNGVK